MTVRAPHSELATALQAAGLSEKEAQVYLAALELGSGTALALSRKTGISRATMYLAAERLIERGLMSSFDKSGKRHFSSEPPSRLMHYLETEATTVSDRKQAVAGVLPALEALLKTDGSRPVVRYYEGLHGLEAMREILVQNRRHEILSAIDLDDYFEAMPIENVRQNQERMRDYQVKGRVLYTCTDQTCERIVQRSPASSTHERRRVPKDQFPFVGEVVVFGDTIAMLSYQNGVAGCIIDHPDFARTMRSLFELAWKSAPIPLE